jgi:hypothetical protein
MDRGLGVGIGALIWKEGDGLTKSGGDHKTTQGLRQEGLHSAHGQGLRRRERGINLEGGRGAGKF